MGNVRRQHEDARTAYYGDDKGDEHLPTQFEIEHHTLFDYLSIPSAPFRRVVAISSTLATVSGRLHQGPKVVSSRAELVHVNELKKCRFLAATKRTWRDVRVEAVMRSKADIDLAP
jgi:hypothetical protein